MYTMDELAKKMEDIEAEQESAAIYIKTMAQHIVDAQSDIAWRRAANLLSNTNERVRENCLLSKQIEHIKNRDIKYLIIQEKSCEQCGGSGIAGDPYVEDKFKEQGENSEERNCSLCGGDGRVRTEVDLRFVLYEIGVMNVKY